MAVMQVQTLEMWPAVEPARLDIHVSALLRRRRREHVVRVKQFQKRVQEWERGLNDEVRRAELRIVQSRGTPVSAAELRTIRQYLIMQRPKPPVFSAIPPWEAMLELAQSVMTEQRQDNERRLLNRRAVL